MVVASISTSGARAGSADACDGSIATSVDGACGVDVAVSGASLDENSLSGSLELPEPQLMIKAEKLRRTTAR